MIRLTQTKAIDDKKELKVLQDNFKCDRYCGHCCKMTVVLDEEDVERLEKKGKKDFWENDILGRKMLKHKDDDYCVFHKKEKDGKHTCTVHKDRPDPCRKYPFFGNVIMECPVLGFDKEIFKNKKL